VHARQSLDHVRLGPAAVTPEFNLEYHHTHPGLINTRVFAAPEHRRRSAALIQTAVTGLNAHSLTSAVEPTLPSPPSPGTTSPSLNRGVIIPTDFGADPTGKTDASVSLAAAIKALLQLGDTTDFQGRVDLGGAVLDLAGGRYLISEPLLFPSGYANFRVQRGTLIASKAFPPTAEMYMLQIGGNE
jgi:hypothetical protein